MGAFRRGGRASGREKARPKVPEATVRGAEGLGDRVGALREATTHGFSRLLSENRGE